MTRRIDDVPDVESVPFCTALTAENYAPAAAEPSLLLQMPTPTPPVKQIPDSVEDTESIEADNAILETVEVSPSQEIATDRPASNGHPGIASVEIVSPSAIQMPKNIRSLPAKGTQAKALLDAGLRLDATVAVSLLHPLVAHLNRDGTAVLGYTNLEYAPLLRLQNIQTHVVVINDSKMLRFLRSRPGALLERLLHSTNQAERLALSRQLMDRDLWHALFDEDLSEELVAALVGVSQKTLTKYLKEEMQENTSPENAEGDDE